MFSDGLGTGLQVVNNCIGHYLFFLFSFCFITVIIYFISILNGYLNPRVFLSLPACGAVGKWLSYI